MHKNFIRITCLVLAILMLVGLVSVVLSSGASAATSDSIQAEIDDLNSQKSEIESNIAEIQSQIDSLDYEMATVREKKEILDQKNILTQQELLVIQEQIDIVDGLISSTQEDLDAAIEEEDYQRERWLARVRAMEENSSMSYIDVIFNATSFSDLLTRIDLVSEVMTYDEQLEQDYIAARENVQVLEAQAEDLYAQNEENEAELKAKQTELEADIQEASDLMVELESDIEAYTEMQEEQEQTEAEVENLIVEKEAELEEAKAAEEAAAKAAAEAAAAAAAAAAANTTTTTSTTTTTTSTTETGTYSVSSGFMWPSYTTTLSSYYGYRTNPVTGIYKLHSGVDIAASYGTAIYAAASGTVILAGWNGGYGNCVMINHGNGYTTLYGHMSSIAVSSGQTVSQGQTIGYVGSTGNSTGPHLHFEVRDSSSGSTINPLNFSYY